LEERKKGEHHDKVQEGNGNGNLVFTTAKVKNHKEIKNVYGTMARTRSQAARKKNEGGIRLGRRGGSGGTCPE